MYPATLRKWLLSMALLLTSPLTMAAPSNCAALEDSGPQWFAAQLDKAQATFKSGNSADAYEQLRQAAMSLPRRADVSLDARCVGPELWQRYYRLRQAITQSLGKKAEQAGKLANTQGALDWYVTGDNQADARRVIPKLTPTANGTAWVIGRLQAEIGSLDYAVQSGFDLLPDEQSARAFWQTGLDGMVGYARQQGQKLLVQEQKFLTRDATARELELEDAQESTRSIVAQFYGDESLAGQNEAQRDVNRAKVSLRILGDARDWFQTISYDEAAPVQQRAVARGDALLAKAGDPAQGLEARDSLYEAADSYFEFAQNHQGRLAVEQGRAALAPALQAERDERSAKLDKKQAEFQKSALQMEQSTHKTDAQKDSFKKEADALQDELGF